MACQWKLGCCVCSVAFLMVRAMQIHKFLFRIAIFKSWIYNTPACYSHYQATKIRGVSSSVM